MRFTRIEVEQVLRRRRRLKIRAARAELKSEVGRGRARDGGYLAYLRRLPCIAGLVEGGCDGSVEAAHLRYSDVTVGRINPGMQAKPSDKWATPLCGKHHRNDQHSGNEWVFWARLRVEPGALSMELYEAYQNDGDALAIVERFAEQAGMRPDKA